MRCERCGMENYDETYYCRGCGLPFGALDTSSEPAIDQKNNSEQSNNSGSFVDSNIYTKNLYSTEEASKQEEAINQDNSDNNKKNSNYKESLQSDNFPQYIYNRDYDFYSTANVRRKSSIEWDKTTISMVLTLAFVIGVFVWVAVSFGKFNKARENNQNTNLAVQDIVQPQTTIPVIEPTQPTEYATYLAELSYSRHTITDFSGEKISVQFPIPNGYKCDESAYNSYAVFSGVVDGGAVARLSTAIFKSDLEKEIDYYEGLLDEDEKPLDVEVTDTDLGEMTVITLENSNNDTIYQVYVKLDKKNYFHISLSNIPDSYEKEAEKLINLIIEDTDVEFIEEEEEKEDNDKDKDDNKDKDDDKE